MNNFISIVILCAMCVPAFMVDEDVEKDTDFPVQQKIIPVHHKQLGGINEVVFKECVLLAERVEC